MTRTNSYAAVAAAVMAVGAWGASAWAQNSSPNPNPGKPDEVKVESGQDTGTWNVRRELENVIQAATAKDGELDGLVRRFVDADRDRIKKEADVDQKQGDLKAKVDQLNSEWKAKYGHEFTTGDDKDLFADATVKFGEMGDTPQLASEVAKNSQNAGGQAKADDAARAKDSDRLSTGGKEKLDKGRDIASVTLPAAAGAPEIRIPLIHEVPMQWKVNVPDTLTYAKLHANLVKHLGMVTDMKDKWPADEVQARKEVARHVFMAILDTGENGSGSGAQQAGDRQSSSLYHSTDSSPSSTDLNKTSK